MARTWVLDTATKGTGAQMVPLDRVVKRPAATAPVLVPRQSDSPREVQPPEPAPKPPRRFRIVDVMTRQTLADGAGTREAVDVLGGVRSLLDVSVYTWDAERDRWRRLGLSEQRVLWEFAHPAAPVPGR